ncbi:MFS transporter [Inquilinus sp. CAU 1745]|uniref:MFS transporter n=1 Tax=Inquilinus sp. CAU 1745 TaxID=3140369 RepID=UPI00325B20C3
MTARIAEEPASTSLNAWFLVAVGFLALAVSFSVRAILGLSMPVIERELGWSYSFLSGVGATALMVTAIVAPFAGRAIDARGPRLLLAGGLVLIAAGAAVVSVATSEALFIVAFGLVAALGFTAVGTNVVAAAIAKRFVSGRGLATGIGTAGATAGQLLVVPMVAVLMQTGSWRDGFLALAAVALLLALVAAIALPGRPSRNVGAPPETGESMAAGILSLVREPVFHILFWSFLICGFTSSGVIETHLLPYASFCGFPPLPSATAYGILCAVNMAGMILSGLLTDRMHRSTLLGAIYLARAATFVLLIYIAPDIRLLYLFAVLYGLFDYSTVPVTVGLAASHLGVHRLGLVMGLISGGHALGGAAGAFAGGILFDTTGGYALLWGGSFALAVLAGLLAFTLDDRPRGEGALSVSPS